MIMGKRFKIFILSDVLEIKVIIKIRFLILEVLKYILKEFLLNSK